MPKGDVIMTDATLTKPWGVTALLIPTVVLWMSMPLHAVGVEAPLRMVTLAYSDVAFFAWALAAPALAVGMGLRLWLRDRSGVGLMAATTAGWFLGLMVCVTAIGRF